MKYAVISSDIPPRVGGIETFTLDFMNHFHSEFGFFPSLIITPARARRDAFPLYPIFEVPNFQLFQRLPLMNPLTVKNIEMFRKLRRENEVIVLVSHLYILNWIVALLMKDKSKIIWINMGANFVNHSSSMVRFISSKYESLGIKILKRCSSARFSISEKANSWIESVAKCSFVVIQNPIPRFESYVSLTNIELDKNQEVSIPKKEIDIIFAARMVEDKRPLEAIRQIIAAFRTLTENNENETLKNLRIEVIGDGPLLENAKNLAKDAHSNMVFLGEVSRSELLEKFRSTKILLQLPRDEGCPLLTLEAISMGVTVVSTPMDTCINELDGIYTADEEKIPDILVALISNKLAHVGLTVRNQKHLREHHSWDNLLETVFRKEFNPQS